MDDQLWTITLTNGAEHTLVLRFPSLSDMEFYETNKAVFDEMRQPGARLFGTRFWQDTEFYNQVFDRVFGAHAFDWKSDVRISSVPAILTAYKSWLSMLGDEARNFVAMQELPFSETTTPPADATGE